MQEKQRNMRIIELGASTQHKWQTQQRFFNDPLYDRVLGEVKKSQNGLKQNLIYENNKVESLHFLHLGIAVSAIANSIRELQNVVWTKSQPASEPQLWTEIWFLFHDHLSINVRLKRWWVLWTYLQQSYKNLNLKFPCSFMSQTPDKDIKIKVW